MPTTQATIVSLQLCPGHRQPMQPVTMAQAVADFGLEGDRHARTGHHRQVLLIEKETLDMLELAPGTVKENITTQGIDLMALSPGQRLRLGPDVVLEITGECQPCGRMDEIREGLRQALDGRRGVNGRVVSSGLIRVGDPVAVI